MEWPPSFEELERVQLELAAAEPDPFRLGSDSFIGGCFVCFTRDREGPGVAGEPGWAAAVGDTGGTGVAVGGIAGAAYKPDYLALREGPLLERAVRALSVMPDVLIVNASGRDHSRRAGLALHLGAVLDIPTVGVTRRPLRAVAGEADDPRGSTAPLLLSEDLVGYMLRTRAGARPVAVHSAWRTDPDTAREIALAACRRARTPEPLRRARRMARLARAWCGALPDNWIPANVSS
jgi:deoxyribonuclease V